MHPSARPSVLHLGLAAAILFGLMVLPNRPADMTLAALHNFPLEWPAVLLALVWAGRGTTGSAVRGLVTALLVAVVALRIADLAMFATLSRGFNPVSDLPLIEAGLRLTAGSAGGVLAVALVAAAVLLLVLIVVLVWWSTGVWSAVPVAGAALPRLAAGGALLFAGLTASDVARAEGWSKDFPLQLTLPGTAFAARSGVDRVQLIRDTLEDLRRFRIAAATDPYAGRAGLLDLIDRDVIVVFVESYGRTSHDTPLYAGLHRETLRRGQDRLEDLGLSMASGYLTSPTRGGQSWLAHSTFANGLWINDQIRYRASLVSGRQTLFHLAQDAGLHTAAVMPQITLDWPEALFMGFDTVLPARDLGYRGLPFNWVTMPDQFTFAALDRLVRDTEPEGRHHVIQIATGTSHAPWVPVPHLVDWDSIGDGTVFNEMAAMGDPPNVVWRDRDRVRAQYRLAIDYALQTVLAYAERHAADPPLMIVIGDHQAAGFVAQDERMDVPVHVIGPAHLVARAAPFAGSPGLIPPPDAPVLPLSDLRDLILRAFSSDLTAALGTDG